MVLLSCGEQPFLLSTASETTDLQIQSVSDGQVVSSGKDLQLTIATQSADKHQDLEMEVTITSASGASVYHLRQAVPDLNKAVPLTAPDLPVGQYRMDVVVYSAGDAIQKKSSSFFVAPDVWRIAGIKSFPPVITAAANVLLRAELEIPSGADPYLRWSWKGKIISRGQLSKGLGQILWQTPADDGVYTVLLEMFPSAPTDGTDFPFTSSLSLSTDIYVSGKGVAGKGDLADKASYLSLLRLQASLVDDGTGAARGHPSATAVGNPQIVAAGTSFGYHLDGASGFQLPWFALPVTGGSLQPFTVSVGLSLEDFQGSGNLVNAVASGGLTVQIVVDGVTRMPSARIATGADTGIEIPWTGPGLERNQRYLLSLSVAPQRSTLTAQWFLDGTQVSVWTGAFSSPEASQDGQTTIGGSGGIVGVVDEFGVYDKDASNRAATDPDLFHRAEESQLGTAMVLADGFDGLYLSDGFVSSGGVVGGGALTLPPDASVSLPAVGLAGAPLDVSVALDAASTPSVGLRLFWAGETDPTAESAIAVNGSRLQLRVAADGRTVTVYPGPDQATLSLPGGTRANAKLVIQLGNPKTSQGPVILQQVLVTAAPTG